LREIGEHPQKGCPKVPKIDFWVLPVRRIAIRPYKHGIAKNFLDRSIRFKTKKPYCKDNFWETSSAVRLSSRKPFKLLSETLCFASPDHSGFALIVMIV
jgi:hypothetical protein